MHLQKGFGLYAPRSDVETDTTVFIILNINKRLFSPPGNKLRKFQLCLFANVNYVCVDV